MVVILGGGVRRHLQKKRCSKMKRKGQMSAKEIADIVEMARRGDCKTRCKIA